ncbi:alpha/beta fold hydrolase, partial [Streptomyces sp. 2MCAF27]
HDLITPMEHSEAIAEVLPGASLVIVEEGGHLVMLEHPEEVNGHLIDLLAQAAGTDTPRAASGGSGSGSGNGRRRSARG